MNYHKKKIKAILDFIIALILLIIFSPVILITSLFLFISNKGSVLFLQQRPGLNMIPFNIIKFKTMLDTRDDSGNLLPDEKRLTKTGKFIRSTSIDELLQLINVLKGEMSLVGPRPLLMQYLDRYSEEQLRRHNVKPGITGWAQVNGRNKISWEERLKLDVYYVDNQSFILDFKILFMTIKNVVFQKGINSENQATMEEFKGSK